MRKTVATALVIATLAIPSFAAVNRDADRRAGDRSPIERVVKFVKRLVGIGPNDEPNLPRP